MCQAHTGSRILAPALLQMFQQNGSRMIMFMLRVKILSVPGHQTHHWWNSRKIQEKHVSKHWWAVLWALGMSLRKVTSLGSNLASVTDLKRNETQHSLCFDFGGYNLKTFTTCWSGGTVQVRVQVRAPAVHLAISLKAVPEGNSERAKSTAKLLGLLSGSACAGQMGEHKHRVFPSLLQSLWAATGSLEENMLPLLLYWLSSRANKVLMLCK